MLRWVDQRSGDNRSGDNRSGDLGAQARQPPRDGGGSDGNALWRWAAFASGLAILWTFTPPDLRLCGFRWLTGRPCPFCGLTHAVFALAKGHWAAALHWHALSPLAVLMLAGMLWNPPRMARVWMPCAAAFGAYGVWRIVF